MIETELKVEVDSEDNFYSILFIFFRFVLLGVLRWLALGRFTWHRLRLLFQRDFLEVGSATEIWDSKKLSQIMHKYFLESIKHTIHESMGDGPEFARLTS